MEQGFVLSNPIVAFEGPRGASHERALGLLRTFQEYESLPMFSSTSVLDSVASVPDLFGVLPVESSMDGLRTSTLDELVFNTKGVLASEEVVLAENIEGFTIKSDLAIDTVVSHPQIIELCQDFIHQNELQVRYVASTDMACAKVVTDRVPTTMALAPSAVGLRHGLKRFERGIYGDPEVRTRYLLIGHQVARPTGFDRTMMLILPAADQVGTLARISEIFGNSGVNMQSIISRPLAESFGRHSFYISCDGHINDKSVIATIEELLKDDSLVKVVGSFPSWVGPDVTSPFARPPDDAMQYAAEGVNSIIYPAVAFD